MHGGGVCMCPTDNWLRVCVPKYLHCMNVGLKLFITSSQVVKGCGGDKCQRQHDAVINAIQQGRATFGFFAPTDASEPLFISICSPKHLFCDCAICGWACARLCVLAFGAPAAARCRAWLISGAELAVLNGPLKRSGTVKKKKKQHGSSLPLLFHPSVALP